MSARHLECKKQLFARGILCQRQNDALPIFCSNAIGPLIAVKKCIERDECKAHKKTTSAVYLRK